MQVHSFPPLVEAFLVLEQPQSRLTHWMQILAPLDDKRAPALASVDGYFDPTCDQALLGVTYDELALGRERLAYVIEVALRAGIGMIQPAELSEPDRRRFRGERLARCTVTVAHQRSVVGALAELVRRMRYVAAVPKAPPPILARGGVPTGGAPMPGGSPAISKPVRRSSPHVIPRVSSPSPPMPPAPPPAPRAEGSQEIVPVEPFAPAASLPPGNIYARYFRSGRWVPLRIGALSLRGAALMTGALPRVDDAVQIALAYADHRAIVRGTVHKVSTQEEAARRGAAGFSVAFELDESSRGQLTALLQAARAANVTIKPPPPRGGRRFPVQWPVCIGMSSGPVRVEALDVSREGMFVRQVPGLVRDQAVGFSVALDDGGGPVCGNARVVRFLDEAAARSSGLAPGHGLRIAEMPGADRARWEAFIARIERRAELRVLIGATTSRMRELQGRLAAAGYAVAVATDPGALVQLASGHERAVDACLIDAGWSPPGSTTTWSEALFPTRAVPCIAMHGDVRRAREAIDQVLSIV